MMHYYMLFQDKKSKSLYRHNIYLHHDYYYYIFKGLHIEKCIITITIALVGGTIMFDLPCLSSFSIHIDQRTHMLLHVI